MTRTLNWEERGGETHYFPLDETDKEKKEQEMGSAKGLQLGRNAANSQGRQGVAAGSRRKGWRSGNMGVGEK